MIWNLRNIARFIGLFLAISSNATLAIDGVFTADKECEVNIALKSNNPGNAVTVVGQKYKLLDFNKEPPTHYLIEVPEAQVSVRRWVNIVCGSVELSGTGNNVPVPVNIPADSIENVLAASWQPTFCATDRGQSKQECQSLTSDRPDATQFSIHGLWPDDLDDTDIFPCYCGSGEPISCKSRLKASTEIELSDPLKAQLDVLMPGVQSGLHLHEWAKHGSCYEMFISDEDVGTTPEEYYAETVLLMKQLNSSSVRDLFKSRLGEIISLDELIKGFDEAFGEGAGNRVFMNCQRIDGQNYISELWIGLGRQIQENSQLGDLILQAPTLDSSTNKKPCNRGRVYRVGA